MQRKSLIEIVSSWMFIFFLFPFSLYAANDSTDRAIIPPDLTSQCFTVRAENLLLKIAPQTINAHLVLGNCTWRGNNKASWWLFGVSNATYESNCLDGEVATGIRHGVRGQFGTYGEYDLYVRCCTLAVQITMSQEWANCP